MAFTLRILLVGWCVVLIAAAAHARDLSGVVTTPDGKLAKNALIALCPEKISIYIYDGKEIKGPALPTATTDDHGRFQLPEPKNPGYLLVIHESGSALLKQDVTNIVLEPWAQLSGQVCDQGQPVPACKIDVQLVPALDEPDKPRLFFTYDFFQTNDKGCYTIPRLRSGSVRLYRRVDIQQGNGRIDTTIDYGTWTKVTNGQKTQLNVDRFGPPVTAQIQIPQSLLESKGWRVGSWGCIAREGPPLPVPAGFNSLSEREKGDWLIKYWQSLPADKRLLPNKLTTRIPVSVNLEGKLTIDSVPPGTYALACDLDATDPTGKSINHISIGRVFAHLVVPEDAREAIDMGTLLPEPPTFAQVGNIVPDLIVQTLDGTGRRLSDYRGRWILIDQWGIWCKGCVDQLPKIQAVCDHYVGSQKLVVLGIANDPPEKLQKFVTERKLTWTQGIDGQWSRTRLTLDFSHSFPTTYLINPKGVIVAKFDEDADILKMTQSFIDAPTH